MYHVGKIYKVLFCLVFFLILWMWWWTPSAVNKDLVLTTSLNGCLAPPETLLYFIHSLHHKIEDLENRYFKLVSCKHSVVMWQCFDKVLAELYVVHKVVLVRKKSTNLPLEPHVVGIWKWSRTETQWRWMHIYRVLPEEHGEPENCRTTWYGHNIVKLLLSIRQMHLKSQIICCLLKCSVSWYIHGLDFGLLLSCCCCSHLSHVWESNNYIVHSCTGTVAGGCSLCRQQFLKPLSGACELLSVSPLLRNLCTNDWDQLLLSWLVLVEWAHAFSTSHTCHLMWMFFT